VEFGNPPHFLASALYKLVYGSARVRGQDDLRRVEGVKAFFLNDPSRAKIELTELAQIDTDMSGTIDGNELMEIRQKGVRISAAERMMELFTTHPNMVKRIKHLASMG
jgi:heat shock protein HtpX